MARLQFNPFNPFNRGLKDKIGSIIKPVQGYSVDGLVDAEDSNLFAGQHGAR